MLLLLPDELLLPLAKLPDRGKPVELPDCFFFWSSLFMLCLIDCFLVA